MAQYDVTLEDGRVVPVHSDNGDIAAARQAEHWDKDRYRIKVRRDEDPGAVPSRAASVTKVKD